MHTRNIELSSKTERLVLRPPELKDVSAVYEAVIVSVEELSKWTEWGKHDPSIDNVMEYLRNLPKLWKEDKYYQFGIFDTIRGEYMGECGLNHINQSHRLANLAYWVRSDRTGEGVASEASRLVAEFGFRELGLYRIEIVTVVENRASRRVAEKVGAHFEGILRRRLKVGEKNVDAVMYSLIPEASSD